MRSRDTRPTAIALTRGLPAYSGAKTTSPPRLGTPKQLPYHEMPDTTPSRRRRALASPGSAKRSESSTAMGRAPIVKMSRRIPPTPVAAPWKGSMNEGWLWLSILNVRARPSPRSTMPAFSPGPWSTCEASVGSPRRNTRECLYAQCSDQSAEKRLSSVKLGSRPSRRMMRSYSSAVRPGLRGSFFVTLGAEPVPPPPPGTPSPRHADDLPLEERAVLDEAAEEGVEDQKPVHPADGLLGRALGVGHQPQHGPLLVDKARDVCQRAVRIGVLGEPAVLLAVAEDDLALLAQAPERRAVAVVLPLAVRDRHLEHLGRPHGPGERSIRVLGAEVHVLAAVLEGLVAGERARQQPRLTEDLEAIARAEHGATARDELRERLHHRRAARHRARAQIVPVGEAAGQHHAVVVGEVGLAMQDVADRLAQHFADHIVKIAITPRAREHHHAESHGR